MKKKLLVTSFVLSVTILLVSSAVLAQTTRTTVPGKPPVVRVICEEEVYPSINPNNGSGPLWCSGSSSIGRIGQTVYATEMALVADAKPLNNCTWKLLKRDANGWSVIHTDVKRTREPSPMAVFPARNEVFVSANPTLVKDMNQYAGPARPEVIRFASDLKPNTEIPKWQGTPKFSEHSYRSFIADAATNELLLLNNIGYTHAEWSLRDAQGKWSAQGQLTWPIGSDYEKPRPIRLCYPTVALKNRTCWFCGVSDIVEPNSQWAAYKRELTKRTWDYDFRRLFFTWSKDITTNKFEPWLEIASCEKTCGWISQRDLYVAADQTVFILWSQRDIDTRLREKFFPDAKQANSLRIAVVRNGKVVSRQIISEVKEGETKPIWQCGRFHATPDGRLWVIAYVSGKTIENGKSRFVNENRLVEIDSNGVAGPAVTVSIKNPIVSFFTASPRAGSLPDWRIDLYGSPSIGAGMRYAQLEIVP